MPKRPPTDAAVLKQLAAVTEKLSAKAAGKQRLALLRKQATLGDQRDAAADRDRRARNDAAAAAAPEQPS
jgi:hypothetical protein